MDFFDQRILAALKVDPGRDLRKEIELYCKGRYVKLGIVFNAFGTLAKARLGLSTNTAPLELNDPVELLSSSGIVREENGQLDTNVNIIVSKDGKLYAGKLLYGCVTSKPEGVNVLFSVIVRGL